MNYLIFLLIIFNVNYLNAQYRYQQQQQNQQQQRYGNNQNLYQHNLQPQGSQIFNPQRNNQQGLHSQQRYQPQSQLYGTNTNNNNNLGLQQHQMNNQLFQNNQQQLQNQGGQPGLLSNPIRENGNKLAANSTTGAPTTFYIKIENYQNGRWILGDGTTCNPPSSCSFAFTFVIASIDGTVVYNSTNFFSVNGNTGQLIQGDWTDSHLYGLHTKPISVDIFVHSLTFSNGYTNGSKYIFNTPVSHVDTFVLNLLHVTPSSSTMQPTSQITNLIGQKMSTSLSLSYYVQCAQGFSGDYCDLQCNNNNTKAICVSTVTGEHRLCLYDSVKQQYHNCSYCDYNPYNNSCANLYYANVKTGVSSVFRTLTILFGCLLVLAFILIIALACLKILGDRRNRQQQQFPQNRQESGYTGGYRPNALNSATPLLVDNEKDWEHNNQPTVIRRQPQISDEGSTPNESFQQHHTSAFQPRPSQQQRREAQV